VKIKESGLRRVSVSLGHDLLEVSEDPGSKSDGGEVHVRGDVVNESRAIDEIAHGLGWDQRVNFGDLT